MKKRNNIKELLGPQYLEVMQTQAMGEIAEAMADPSNAGALHKAMLTMTRVQHELILAWAKAHSEDGVLPPPCKDAMVGGIKGGQGGSTSL